MANPILERKLENDIKKLQEEGLNSRHYYLANSEHFKNIFNTASYEGKKYAYDLCNQWDHYGSIDKSIGESIEFMINSDDYYFGIHRSDAIDGEDYENDEVLHSILDNGLVVLGDLSSGAIRNDADPSKTVSICNNMLNAVIMLKTSYKGSTGAVCTLLPKSCVDEEGHLYSGKEEEVYDYNNGYPYIKPEYIIGFMSEVNGNCDFHTKDEILKGYSDKTR